MQIHAAVNHALTPPRREKIHMQILTGKSCLQISRLRFILAKRACHRYAQISAHRKVSAHTHSSAHRQWENTALIHNNTYSCSRTRTGLALFWPAALRWAVWGFRGIGQCWLCREPAEPLRPHSCLPHHLRRASNRYGKSVLGRAEYISHLPSSPQPPFMPDPPTERGGFYCFSLKAIVITHISLSLSNIPIILLHIWRPLF